MKVFSKIDFTGQSRINAHKWIQNLVYMNGDLLKTVEVISCVFALKNEKED